MTVHNELFPELELAAQAMLMTPTTLPDGSRYEDIYALARAVGKNIFVAGQPYLEAAESEDAFHIMRADMAEVDRTIYEGFDNIDDILYIADSTLREMRVGRPLHEGILRRSSRLVMSATRLNNGRLGELLDAGKRRHSAGSILESDVQPPMEMLGSGDSTSLSWSWGLLQWMRLAQTQGCPARTAIVDAEGQKRQTLMQLMWDKSVTVHYGAAEDQIL